MFYTFDGLNVHVAVHLMCLKLTKLAQIQLILYRSGTGGVMDI